MNEWMNECMDEYPNVTFIMCYVSEEAENRNVTLL